MIANFTIIKVGKKSAYFEGLQITHLPYTYRCSTSRTHRS